MGKDRTKLRKRKEKSVKVKAMEGELADLALNLRVVDSEQRTTNHNVVRRVMKQKDERGV